MSARDAGPTMRSTAIASLLIPAVALSAVLFASGCCARPAPALTQVRAAYEAGKYAEAERLGEAVVKARPDDIDARRMLGLVLSASGDAKGAIEQFDSVLEARPRDHETLFRRAVLRRGTGDTAGAISDLRSAARLSSPTTTYLEELAKTLQMDGQYEDAAAAWARLLENAGLTTVQRIAFLKQSASALESAGREQDADEAWEKVLELEPQDADALEALGKGR